MVMAILQWRELKLFVTNKFYKGPCSFSGKASEFTEARAHASIKRFFFTEALTYFLVQLVIVEPTPGDVAARSALGFEELANS